MTDPNPPLTKAWGEKLSEDVRKAVLESRSLPSAPPETAPERKSYSRRTIVVPRSIVVEHPMRGAKPDCSVILDEDGALWLQEPEGMTPLIVLRASRIRIVEDGAGYRLAPPFPESPK